MSAVPRSKQRKVTNLLQEELFACRPRLFYPTVELGQQDVCTRDHVAPQKVRRVDLRRRLSSVEALHRQCGRGRSSQSLCMILKRPLECRNFEICTICGNLETRGTSQMYIVLRLVSTCFSVENRLLTCSHHTQGVWTTNTSRVTSYLFPKSQGYSFEGCRSPVITFHGG